MDWLLKVFKDFKGLKYRTKIIAADLSMDSLPSYEVETSTPVIVAKTQKLPVLPTRKSNKEKFLY